MSQTLTDAAVKTLITPSFAVSATKKTITGVASADGVTTVTCATHGFSTGDWLYHADIGGAVEANGLVQITKTAAGAYTIDGLASVTTYTSGGTAQKVTVTGFTRDLKPYKLIAILESLKRRPVTLNADGDSGASESTLATIYP